MFKQEFEFDIPKYKFESIKAGYLTFIIFEKENYCFQKGDILKLYKITSVHEYHNKYHDKNDIRTYSKCEADKLEFYITYIDHSIDGYVIVGISNVEDKYENI